MQQEIKPGILLKKIRKKERVGLDPVTVDRRPNQGYFHQLFYQNKYTILLNNTYEIVGARVS